MDKSADFKGQQNGAIERLQAYSECGVPAAGLVWFALVLPLDL